MKAENPNPDFLTVKQAAEKACVSTTTIHTWCERYGIGRKVGGRYRISPKKLGEILEGNDGQ